MNLEKDFTEFVKDRLIGKRIKVWECLETTNYYYKGDIYIRKPQNFIGFIDSIESVKTISSIDITDGGSSETVGITLTFDDSTQSWTPILNDNLFIV